MIKLKYLTYQMRNSCYFAESCSKHNEYRKLYKWFDGNKDIITKMAN